MKYHLKKFRNRPDEACHSVIEARDGAELAGRLVTGMRDDTLGFAMDEGPGLDDGQSGEPGVHFAWLERLEVVEKYQRQGIGQTLIDKAARRLGRLGFEWLYVVAYPVGNTSLEQLIRFYRACEFRVERRADRGGKLMSRPLF